MALDEEAQTLEKLYKYGETLASAKDKAQHDSEYLGLIAAATGSAKAKLIAAQQIPRFFKHFPLFSAEGINAQLDLCEDEDIAIRIPAIRGLPYLCKDTPEHVPKIADVLGQLLIGDEQEHVVVQNSLMQVLRQDPKESLSAIFKHVESPEDKLRERVLAFLREKVFPSKSTILVPQKEMERHVTNLIKAIQDVTGDEFAMFLSFLSSLSLFSSSQPSPERMQELVGVVEGQADLDAKFDVSDGDHVERVLSCLQLALPFFKGGGSNSKFIAFISEHIIPKMDQLPEGKSLQLLKALAECAPHTAPAQARALLPSLVRLIKDLPPSSLDLQAAESLLYAFHLLASKVPNASNPLCGYHIVTGQPSDGLGEDVTAVHQEWMAKLSELVSSCKERTKEISQSIAKATKEERELSAAAAKKAGGGKKAEGEGEAGEAEEAAKKLLELRQSKAADSRLLRSATNVDRMAKALQSKTPKFIPLSSAPSLSWLQAGSPAPAPTAATALGGRGAGAGRGMAGAVGSKRASNGLGGGGSQARGGGGGRGGKRARVVSNGTGRGQVPPGATPIVGATASQTLGTAVGVGGRGRGRRSWRR